MAPLNKKAALATIPWDKDISFPKGGILVGAYAVICYKERPVPGISKKVHVKVYTNQCFCTCISFDDLVSKAFHDTLGEPEKPSAEKKYYLVHLEMSDPVRDPEGLLKALANSVNGVGHALTTCNRK